MIAVVAGNYTQYQYFLHAYKLNRKEYFYVSYPKKIHGLRKLKYILFGTYYERPDYNEIILRLQSADFEKLDKFELRTTPAPRN